MVYFKTRMRSLRGEYTRPDRDQIIAAAGGKCSMPSCGRKDGDEFVFGPTNYLKRRLKFKVYMDIHVIEGGEMGTRKVVLCSGCHMGYHLFNRLTEEAEFGKPLKKTIYKRCRVCGELKCRCCKKCGEAPKWCRCKTRSRGKS